MLLRGQNFADNAYVNVRIQLERVLHRVQLSAVELELQPEAFQATEELRLASGELASVIEKLECSNKESLVLDGFRCVKLPRAATHR